MPKTPGSQDHKYNNCVRYCYCYYRTYSVIAIHSEFDNVVGGLNE